MLIPVAALRDRLLSVGMRYGDHTFRLRHNSGPSPVGAPDHAAGLGHLAACALSTRLPGLRRLSRRLRPVAGAQSGELCRAVQRPDLRARRGQHADLPGHRHQREDADRAVPVRLLRPAAPVDQMAVGDLHPALGGAGDPDHPVGPLHAQSRMGHGQPFHLLPHRRWRPELAERSDGRRDHGHRRAYLEVAAVLDADPADRAARDPAGSVRGVRSRRRQSVAEIPLHHLAVDADALRHLHAALDDLDARRLQHRLSAHWRRAGRPHARAVDPRHPLSPARPALACDGLYRLRDTARAAADILHDETVVAMKLPTLREVGTEAKLLLIGIPVFIWTMIPIYHMFLFAISPKEDAFSGKLWPDHPTLHNFHIVFYQEHYFLRDFWIQFWNSTVIALAAGALTLFIATAAAFSISRL